MISPEWPGDRDGYQIALRSSLFHMMKQYERVEYLVIDSRKQPEMAFETANCRFTHIPIPSEGQGSRFLKSLVSGVPAVCVRFSTENVKNAVRNFLSQELADVELFDVVYEDVPVTVLKDLIANDPAAGKHTLRSHNVLSQAFSKFSQQGKIHRRLAWRLENSRIRRFEEQALKSMDSIFAITLNDKQVYHGKFPGIEIDYQDVSFSSDFFEKCEVLEELIEPVKIISLGGCDLRKSHGMTWFISECFKPVRVESGESIELVLGGKATQDFDQPDAGVQGLGFVASEREFMRMGNIFVNPQLVGSGVKLKSLVAMSYGKCLLTTPIGIEGIAGNDGEHFLIASNAAEAKAIINQMISGEIDLIQIGKNAREIIKSQYLDHSVENRMFKN